jgi:hypothetical protein
MGHSLTDPAPAAHRITAEDRLERIGQLTSKQCTDALLWLAGYAPDVFDAVTEAVEPCAGDGSEDPEPICAICGPVRSQAAHSRAFSASAGRAA